MDTVSSSDYLSVKKRAALDDVYPQTNASVYTQNKQYYTLQTTAIFNTFGEPESTQRFSRDLPSKDLALIQPKLCNPQYTYQPLFVLPNQTVEPYVKNRPLKPFGWACPSSKHHSQSHYPTQTQPAIQCNHSPTICNACMQTQFYQQTGMFYM